MSYIQPVSSENLYNYQSLKPFAMIDNYIYVYHTDTLIALPLYPESIQDSMEINYAATTPLLRSAPIYSYQSSGPRSIQLELPLHRDMTNQINMDASTLKIPDIEEEDYVDVMINQLQAAALPRYVASEKMVNPPLVAVRFGNDLFCKGVIQGGVTVTKSGPILRTDNYALVTVAFNMHEVDPYDADTVAQLGSFRGLTPTLERRIYK